MKPTTVIRILETVCYFAFLVVIWDLPLPRLVAACALYITAEILNHTRGAMSR